MKKTLIFTITLCLCFTAHALALELGSVDIHGFVSQGYLKSDANNYLAETEKGTYQFNEVGINFNVTKDKLRVGAQIFSRDLGDLGNNDVKLDWAMGEYRMFDELGVRAGRLKVPFGFYNQGRDIDLLRTPIFLPTSVYDEGSRDMLSAVNGFGMFGNIDAHTLGGFEYEAFIGASEIEEDSLFVRGALESFQGFVDQSMAAGTTGDISNFEVENKNMGGGAIRWDTPLPGFRLGTSILAGEAETDGEFTFTLLPIPLVLPTGYQTTGSLYMTTKVSDAYVFSGEYTWENLTLASEFYMLKLTTNAEIRGLDLTPLAPLGITELPPIPENVAKYEGWYVQGSYQILDWLTVGLYYSEFYGNADDKDGQRFIDQGLPASYAWEKKWVPTLRFDPVPNWVIKAEVHFVDGTAHCYHFNNPDGLEEDWNLYSLKTSFSF